MWTAAEWSAFGTVLIGLGTAGGALAVWREFKAWRRQKLTERRIEQAERILAAAYKSVTPFRMFDTHL